jgi:diguanylate cyclase (GGDEF)-like protein
VKILIADDDAISLRIMEKMLRTIGYDVAMAINGSDALEKLLESDGPRLALLDWMMPELDGPQVCSRMRAAKDHSYVYVILLTAKNSKEDLVEGLNAGADDYLTKPCNVEELKARLRTGQRILQLEDRLVAAREEMRYKATHDALTTLCNRGKIIETLDKALLAAEPTVVMLCDVDHFKRINDEYGHVAGDGVLQEVARRLRFAVRADDAIGRYGGEEFLVVLRGCDPQSMPERAEQLRSAVAGDSFRINGREIVITVSIGGLAIKGREDTLITEAVLQRVDSALYKAKDEGRNRVVIEA